MPIEDSAAVLVARFLKSNNYENTLDAFLAEANLPADAGSLPTKSALTLEHILDEKRQFDKSTAYTKETDQAGADSGWGDTSPSVPSIIERLPSSANLLKVLVGKIHQDGRPRSCLIASAADRRVSVLSTEKDALEVIGSLPPTPVDSPVLDCVVLGEEQVVVAAMSGLVCLYNLRTHQKSERRDHKKYVVKVAACADEANVWVATAGWDSKILLYLVRDGALGDPVAEVTLTTNPETLLFAKDHDTDRLFLLASRRDSSSVHYYLIKREGIVQDDSSTACSVLIPAGSQNLAPHSNAWVAFSPSAMALCPTDPMLLAVATSSLPHMKAIIVRLLFPSDASITTQPLYTTQAEQERGRLVRQDYEETAIQVHISTMAPQTPYSTPQVCWRPNGRGIYVNGDDGVIRGIEAKTGKIKSILKDGHEIGSKIRSIWAGWVGDDGDQEWLVSGGFDKRLVVWRSP